MSAVSKLLYSTVGIIFLISGVYFMLHAEEMEKDRSKVLIEDEVKKSSIQLNPTAAEGNCILTWEEAYTTIMNCPSTIVIEVDDVAIPQETRILCERKLKDLRQYLPKCKYKAYYTFDDSGQTIKVNFKEEAGT